MRILLQHPVKKVSINQSFGNVDPMYTNIGLKGHNGLDYHAPDGTPVLAAHDGTVTYAGLDGSNGNLIVIMTDSTFDYNGTQSYFKSLYCHLKTGTYKVTAGDKVKVGQVIALADNSGMSTGSHLHFGFKPVLQGEQPWQWYNLEQDNGYNGAIDPKPYLPEYQEFTVDLKMGDTGDEVEKMQAFLIRHKYMRPVTTLGFYGEITANALLNFQIANIKDLSWYERYVMKGKTFGPKTRKAFNIIS